MTERRQTVLEALVNEYIIRAMPVGSRTLAESYQLGVSAATVRNELAELEGEGYVVSPHTSAGRIPTDLGYRSFVDSLLATTKINNDEVLAKELQLKADRFDELSRSICEILAHCTKCLAIVVEPDSTAHLLGMPALLMQPEFHYAEQIIPLLALVEDNIALLSLFASMLESNNMVIRIGHEIHRNGFDEVAVVARAYETSDAQGLVAVVGPTRMDYKKAITAVSTASSVFEEVL